MNLKCDILFSKFAFKCNLCRYTELNPVRTTDKMAPFFKPGYPRITKVRGDSFMLVAQLDEPGTVYFVIDEGGSIASHMNACSRWFWMMSRMMPKPSK